MKDMEIFQKQKNNFMLFMCFMVSLI